MRRTLTLAAAALLAAGTLRAQQVVARVGGELTGLPYSQVLVPITVDMTNAGGARLGSYTARLTWSTSVLGLSTENCCGNQDSTLQGNFPAPAVNTDSAYYGVLKFTAISPTGVGSLVTIAQLPFYTSGSSAPDTLRLSFSEMSAAGTFTSLLPILTVRNATFCLARGRWGDLDADGQANSRDALFTLTQVVGLAVDPQLADTTLADVDADGHVTSRDALIILSYAVGLSISGQRVMLLAPGSCGTGSAQHAAILPSAIELVVNQAYRLVAQVTDSAGHAVATPSVTWRSSDYTIASVDNDGTVLPRSAGTVTITAEIGPGVTATATVTVIARRPNWYVDIAATGNAVQNGSQTYPYEHPMRALSWVSEGDTVRVARGTYYWDNDGELRVGIVLLGGTPGDTTTRPVFRDPTGYYTALWLRGGQRTVVRNVVFQNFDEAIDFDGVRNFAIEDSKIVFTGDNYGYGIYHCGAAMDTVRIDRTAFLGDSTTRYGTAVYYSGCSNPAARVTLLRDSRLSFVSDGLYLYGADSVAVLRSVISDNSGDGLYLSQEYSETPALYVAHSRVERNRYGNIEAYYLRRAVIDTSVVRADSNDALNLEGDYYTTTAEIYLRGDSIYQEANYYDWLSTYYTDSLIVQDVVVRAPPGTSINVSSNINADVAVVRRTRFLNLGGYYTVFDFDGRRLLADSVTMTGCAVAGCDGAYGFYASLSGSQPLAQILRSSFTQIYAPVYAYGSGAVLEARNLTADSVNVAVDAYYLDSADVRNNVVTRAGYAGIQLQSRTGSRGPSLIAGNRIRCASASAYRGVLVESFGAIVESDTIVGCQKGVELYYAGAGSRVRRNALRDNSYGIYLYQYPDTALIRADSNGIDSSDVAAVGVVYAHLSLTHNRIENNPGDGLNVYSSLGTVTQARDNSFVSNTGFAVYTGGDSVDASANYWGTGGAPPASGSNSVSSHVNTSSPLATAPTHLPGLAPLFSPAIAATAAPSARSEAPGAVPIQPPAAPQVAFATATVPGRSPERIAQIERNRARWTAQRAAAVEREAGRLARRQARLAERIQRERQSQAR